MSGRNKTMDGCSGMGADAFESAWLSFVRPALTSAAGAAVASTAQQVMAQPLVQAQAQQLAVQKSAEGLQVYINWVKDNPARAAMYVGGAILALMASGIVAYKVIVRK